MRATRSFSLLLICAGLGAAFPLSTTSAQPASGAGGSTTSANAVRTVSAAQQVWDPTADFSITNQNPNGVWTYGWMDTGFKTFTPFTRPWIQNTGPAWSRSSSDNPQVWVNTRSGTSFGVPVGALSLHPGQAFEPSVVRWTAPISGAVRVNGRFLAGDSGTMQVAVRRGTTVLWSASNAGAFDLTETVSAGDTLDFAVFGSYFFGNTPLQLSITAIAAAPPTIATQPASQIVDGGQTVTLSVAATGTALAYQWRRDGTNIPGATNATLSLPNVQAAEAGSYTVVVTSSSGSVTSAAAVLEVLPSRIVNLSIRANAGNEGNTLIVGLVVGLPGTSGTKPILIRGAGPSLTSFGVSGFLADPSLALYSGATSLATNDNWAGDSLIVAAGALVGAFPWTDAASRDAALFRSAVANGSYTVQVTGAGGTTGNALAEIYDATPASAWTMATPRLVNVSARTLVGTGDGILIAGFVVRGGSPKTVLIRGVGPTLASSFGVAGVLADPRLELYSGATLVQSNDNWGGTAALVSASAAVGAFALPATSRDAVLQVSLPPGSYTAQVSGVNNTTGVALVEIYEMP